MSEEATEHNKSKGPSSAQHRVAAEEILAGLPATEDLTVTQQIAEAQLHVSIAQLIAWNKLNETLVTALGTRRGGGR